MMVEVKYTDIHGRELSLQQVNAVQSYEKLTYDSGTLKLIESFRKVKDKLYKSHKYFLDLSEDKDRIIEEYAIKTNSRLVIYLDKQPSGAYSLWNYEEYSQEGVIIFKGKMTFDSLFRRIFSCSCDLLTGAIFNSYKYFYGDHYDEKVLLLFEYYSNGHVKNITNPSMEFGYIKPINLREFLADTELSQKDFPWDQHAYYHSVYPFLPEGPL